MHTTIGFMGHLEQIYATEQFTQQICRFKDVINYKIAFSAWGAKAISSHDVVFRLWTNCLYVGCYLIGLTKLQSIRKLFLNIT